ncbi:MAG: EamA family transporter [Acidobacteriota bacterium]
MRDDNGIDSSLRVKIVLAFAAIYLIWGSTYLAIKFAIETMPPFLMAGIRFLISGMLLYGWTRLRGTTAPKLIHWRSAVIIGGLLLLAGNGAVVWSEQRVPSGLTALLVATIPLWMVVLEWARSGVRPGIRVVGGLLLGIAALVLLASPSQIIGGEQIDYSGVLALMLGTFCWASGSLYSRSAQLPASPLLGTAMQMIAGGVLLCIAGVATGEVAQVKLTDISLRSLLAVSYLIVFGSLIGFTAYVWLLRVTTPARISTYAYVNPVVAIVCGWMLGGETISTRTLVVVGMIILAVVSINSARIQSSVKKEKRTVRSMDTKRLPADQDVAEVTS